MEQNIFKPGFLETASIIFNIIQARGKTVGLLLGIISTLYYATEGSFITLNLEDLAKQVKTTSGNMEKLLLILKSGGFIHGWHVRDGDIEIRFNAEHFEKMLASKQWEAPITNLLKSKGK